MGAVNSGGDVTTWQGPRLGTDVGLRWWIVTYKQCFDVSDGVQLGVAGDCR